MLFTVFRGLRQARNAILAMSQSLGFYVVWGSKSGPGAEKIALKIASTQMAKHAPNIAPKMAQHGARRRGGALAGGRINFCEAFIKIVSQI